MERTKKFGTISIFAICFMLFLFGTGSIGCSQTNESKKLIEDLNSLSLNTKEKAIDKLVDMKAKRAVDPLIAILNDKDEDIGIREKAAIALGKIKSKKSIEPLIAVLKDEDIDARWNKANEFAGRLWFYYGAIQTRAFIDSNKIQTFSLNDIEVLDPSSPDNNFIYTGNIICNRVKVSIDSKNGLPEGPYIMDSTKDKYGRYRYIYAFSKDEKGTMIYTTNINIPDSHDISKVTFDFSDSSKNYVVDRKRSVRKASAWALNEMKDDKRVEEAFITALKDKNLAVVAGAYKFFLEKLPDAQDTLVEALKEYGDKQMAEDFLKSGNSKLQTAGQEWVKQNEKLGK